MTNQKRWNNFISKLERIPNKSLREKLEFIYLKDVDRYRNKTFTNDKNVEMHYDESRECFIGTDGKGREWMAEVPTMVPIYWQYCGTEIQGKDGFSRRCGYSELVGIWEDGKDVEWGACGHTNKVTITIPKNQVQHKLLEQIRRE